MLNFVCFGAQKCGTTWLYEQLRQHPDLGFPGGKEVHFWNQHYGNGVDSYRALFSNNTAKNGDITPAYALLEPRKIEELKKINPKLKLIYTVRDPIERVWSAALMALRMADMQTAEASDAWFIDFFKAAGTVRRTDYSAALQNWLSVFDRSQLLLLHLREISDEPAATLERIATHLDVDPTPFSQLKKSIKSKVNTGESATLRHTLRHYLETHYADLIQRQYADPLIGPLLKKFAE